MHCLKFLLYCLGEYAQKTKMAAIKMRPVSHVQAAKNVCVFWVWWGSLCMGLP